MCFPIGLICLLYVKTKNIIITVIIYKHLLILALTRRKNVHVAVFSWRRKINILVQLWVVFSNILLFTSSPSMFCLCQVPVSSFPISQFCRLEHWIIYLSCAIEQFFNLLRAGGDIIDFYNDSSMVVTVMRKAARATRGVTTWSRGRVTSLVTWTCGQCCKPSNPAYTCSPTFQRC